MLLVKTKIGPSRIHGIGLFADEFIPKGTVIWKFVSYFDLKFTKGEVIKMPQVAQSFFKRYSYLSRNTGYYIIDIDNARFYNHSKNPNTESIAIDGTDNEGGDIAVRDILKGEEITCDYEKDDAEYKLKLM